jgi:hypothetical protein
MNKHSLRFFTWDVTFRLILIICLHFSSCGGEVFMAFKDYSKDRSFRFQVDPHVYQIEANKLYYISMCGAEGGSSSNNYRGGLGGCLSFQFYANASVTWYIVVGSKGGRGDSYRLLGGVGGFNGGGRGSSGPQFYANYTSGGGGGGASDIRLSPNDISSRIYVAGGGGGAGMLTYNYCFEIV